MKRLTLAISPRARRRGGFTLIELLMTIAIIAVLIALLFPAISSIKAKVRITEVRQEISQLESAIADFKFKFGSEPPSSITFYERWDDGSGGGPGWLTDSVNRAKIRRLWPKFDFNLTRDINGNGVYTDTYTLKGDQCLVFFLGGGYINGGTDSAQFIGFSGDPTNPFKVGASASTTRIGPFFEFDMDRVLDTSSLPYSSPLATFPVYLDPIPGQTKPYLYATSYDGRGYYDTGAASDVSTAASDSNLGDTVAEFRIYRTDTKDAATDPDPPAWKPNGFQIISPGPDNEYGTGGPYKPNGNIVLPALIRIPNPSAPPPLIDGPDGARLVEDDNITNFAGGTLD